MNGSDVLVVLGAVVLTGLAAWFFFAPKRSHRAEVEGGVQVVTVTVKGGYSPDLIDVVSGVPVRLVFDRQESGDCSSRVVMPQFHVNQTLPAFKATTIEFTPDQAGEFEFACGMNMLRGRIRVAAQTGPGGMAGNRSGQAEDRSQHVASADGAGVGGDAASMDAEAEDRRIEIADLKRRVLWGRC